MTKDQNILKETKYCKIHNQGRYVDHDYTYCIEKIYVKDLNRFEIRFCLYKDLKNYSEKYIARSLDVTELELVDLFKDSIANDVFSKELIEALKIVFSTPKKSKILKDNEVKDNISNVVNHDAKMQEIHMEEKKNV